MQDKGIGDTVERIFKAAGIKTATEIMAEVFGKDCKCKDRQKLLNKYFPYSMPVKIGNVSITNLTDDNLDAIVKDLKKRF